MLPLRRIQEILITYQMIFVKVFDNVLFLLLLTQSRSINFDLLSFLNVSFNRTQEKNMKKSDRREVSICDQTLRVKYYPLIFSFLQKKKIFTRVDDHKFFVSNLQLKRNVYFLKTTVFYLCLDKT